MHILSTLFSCRKPIDGESAKDRAIAVLKRAISGIRPRRRRSEKEMEAEATPPQDAAAAPAPEPAAQQPNVNNASAQNDISIPPSPSNDAPVEPAAEPEAPPADTTKSLPESPHPDFPLLDVKTVQAYQQLKDGVATTSPPLDTKTTDDYPDDTKEKPGPVCHICHEPTGVPRTDTGPDAGKTEELAALPCGHLFGHHCLLQWLDLQVGQVCPLCRQLAQHSECRHPAMPALAKDAPPFLFKGNPPLPPKCMTCRIETEPGMQMLKLEWQMAEARGLAITSMRQVPRDLHASQIELEWQRLGESTKKVRGSWDEELERVWLKSQKGRGEW